MNDPVEQSTAQNPATRPARRKPVREQLHQAVNTNLTALVENGFKDIDRGKRRLVRKLAKKGITGVDELADTGANLLKALILRGISK